MFAGSRFSPPDANARAEKGTPSKWDRHACYPKIAGHLLSSKRKYTLKIAETLGILITK
jgi:hypothetical protein